MDMWYIIIISLFAFIGLVMASIGIDFYNKCDKNKKLSKNSRNFLVVLLIVFIILIIGLIYLGVKKTKSY